MTQTEALRLALEALEYRGTDSWRKRQPAITAIKAALEAKDEPVACGACNGSGRMVRDPDIGTDQECFVCEGTLEAKDEAVAFKIYKPTPPRHATPNVRDAELPWVYDQDPSSGNVASMWVTPVQTAADIEEARGNV